MNLTNDCLNAAVSVKVTNGDGKSLAKDIFISKSPAMKVNSATLSKTIYGLGETPVLTVKGYSIYGTAKYRITRTSDGAEAISFWALADIRTKLLSNYLILADSDSTIFN